MQRIRHYFPKLNEIQYEQLGKLLPFYTEWNEKINVVSRKDIDNLYLHHVLHALALAKIIQFKSFTNILDIGTGGGFPGIPLAILFPHARFHLVDAIGKKIKVVQEAVQYLGLENVDAEQARVEQLKGKQYDFVVSRGVTQLKTLHEWAKRVVVENRQMRNEQYNKLANGLFAYKGGDLEAEITDLGRNVKIFPISDYFNEPFFDEKYIIYLRC
jgi:16S rRNA (guanine527-N7)-methyltransferase